MIDFSELQIEVYNQVSQEKVIQKDDAAAIVSMLPQMRTVEDLEELELQGYNVRSAFGTLNPRPLQPNRVRLDLVNQGLKRELEGLLAIAPAREVRSACLASARLALSLLLQPPNGIEVCSRNPKQELPQFARLLVQAKLQDEPVPFVVPCCPDTNQYHLGDGLGDIIPKGLNYCTEIEQLLVKYGFGAHFDLQVADVEGLDPVILERTGETTQTHFAKTAETIRKAQAEVARRGGKDFMAVRSMQAAFLETGGSYQAMQSEAADRITSSPDRKVRKTIDGLFKERTRLGNFDQFDDDARRELVIAELAGYAAYGAMVDGRAVILSPDAMSAIPAYHYSLDAPAQFSPVLYAK